MPEVAESEISAIAEKFPIRIIERKELEPIKTRVKIGTRRVVTYEGAEVEVQGVKKFDPKAIAHESFEDSFGEKKFKNYTVVFEFINNEDEKTWKGE